MTSLTSSEKTASLYGTAAYTAAGKTIMEFTPPSQICAALNAIHTYSDDPKRQVQSFHYCHHRHLPKYGLFHQCIIYDSDKADARLIGIEYLVNEETYKSLPDQERRYWHSHKFEVESGLLMLQTKSGIPNAATDEAEQPAMLNLRKLYGKTIHTWAFDESPDLPIGPPRLMMSVIDDKDVNQDMIKARDQEYGVSTEGKRQLRQGYIPKDGFEPHPDADSWKNGKGIVFEPKEVPLK